MHAVEHVVEHADWWQQTALDYFDQVCPADMKPENAIFSATLRWAMQRVRTD